MTCTPDLSRESPLDPVKRRNFPVGLMLFLASLYALPAYSCADTSGFGDFPISSKGCPAPAKNLEELSPELVGAAPGAKKANFAQCWHVTEISCGTSCSQIALTHLPTNEQFSGPVATVGATFRVNSRLLVLNPAENISEAFGDSPPEWAVTEHFVLQPDGVLEQVH